MAEATKAKAVPEAPVYTRDYIILFLANLLVFFAFYILLPIIPLYILSLGGTEGQVGLLIAVTGIATLIGSPFYGRAVDVWGRKRILLIGLVISSAVAASFVMVRNVIAFAFPLLMRSVGSSASQTASRTFVFDVTPAARRGEAISTFMMAPNLAIAFGPAVGVFLADGFGMTTPFLVTAVLCIVALLLVLLVKEPYRPAPAKAADKTASAPKKNGWFVREAMYTTLVQIFLASSYGSTIQFLSVLAKDRQINNFQVFFTVYAVIVLSARFITGRLSDKIGRAAVLLPAMLLQAGAIFLLSVTHDLGSLLVVAVGMGLGWGTAYPTLTALTADQVEPARRGAAMGIFSAGMALGSSIGAASVGWLAEAFGFTGAFIFTASMVLVGFVVAVIGLRAYGLLTLRPAIKAG